MATKIHLLEQHPALKRHKRRIRSIARDALRRIRSKIPVGAVDIVVGHNPWAATPHVGISGYAPHGRLVLLWLDAEKRGLEKLLPVQLPRTLAHELHHVARWNCVGYGRTLLEALVSEGLADHFELEVAGGKPEIWDRALKPTQMTKLMRRARREFGNRKYSHDEWFFGSYRRGGIPRWAGYSLGFKLVGDYLARHPRAKPSRLYRNRAREFLT